MTRKEAMRQTQQENMLLELGFTRDEADALRRISMTLHRWHELECGTDRYCLVRGRMVDGEFTYDDDGAPFYEFAGVSGRGRYSRTPDRETGAKQRLAAIIAARNSRPMPTYMRPGAFAAYIQTDPRGAALYILRPGDVPEGKAAESYYTRGVCVY